ncbi:MAG: zinc ribbon domain-containing protein [Bryobacteraceae bacterium]
MPIFEYRCDDCGNRFEKLVRRAAENGGTQCPSCGKEHVTQQFSTFAAHSNGGAASEMPACPGGVCSMPSVCGRN